jgi:DNA-directed RNA polymerase subunit RPC12/RpoP
MEAKCAGSGNPIAVESDGRARCPYCGHRINVTVSGRLFGHNGRRASAPRKAT